MKIQSRLVNIQNSLKVPKNQYNNFGKYSYRSCEDILEAVKPLLKEEGLALTIHDEITLIGDRYYVKATVKIFNEMDSIEVTAYAREDETKKGQDLAQLTGSTSSYARKYALNGLFAIDDTKDSDATNMHGKGQAPTQNKQESTKGLSDAQIKRLYAIAKSVNIDADTVKSQVKTKFNKEISELTKSEYDTVCKGYEGLKK